MTPLNGDLLIWVAVGGENSNLPLIVPQGNGLQRIYTPLCSHEVLHQTGNVGYLWKWSRMICKFPFTLFVNQLDDNRRQPIIDDLCYHTHTPLGALRSFQMTSCSD